MKSEACRGCPLYNEPGPVWGEGPKDALIALVGEAPALDKKARHVLNIGLQAAGIARALVYITTTVKCAPSVPGRAGVTRTPTAREIAHCARAFLYDELRSLAPHVVVPLGEVALGALTRDGKERAILEWRGCVMEVPEP